MHDFDKSCTSENFLKDSKSVDCVSVSSWLLKLILVINSWEEEIVIVCECRLDHSILGSLGNVK